jgi:hypothetical protein
MGKKNKKFRSRQARSSISTAPNIASGYADNQTIEPISQEDQTVVKAEEETDHYNTDKYDHVKKDVRKIVIIMASIVIILFAIYFGSLKTNYLNSLGDFIYRISHLQTS